MLRAQTEAQASADMSAILLEQADRLFLTHIDKATLSTADAGVWPGALWAAVQEAGLPLALVPEAAGGVGLGFADGSRLIRRAAFHAAPVPLAETMVAGALWAAAGGAVPEGVLTLAPPCIAHPAIMRQGGGFSLSGTVRRVPWGGRADYCLVVARGSDGETLLALAPGGSPVQNHRNLANEPRDTLQFDALTLDADAVRPAPAALHQDGLLLHGAAIRVQQMVGAMERALDHALLYASERAQFGRPLAKFQAIQHMLAAAAGAYAAATAAADALADARDDAAFAFWVAVAKARAGEAAGQVAAISHQVHGAMGFTQEHPLHFSTRRLWSWRDEFGSESFWQTRLGAAVCAAGGAGLWPMLVTSELAPPSA